MEERLKEASTETRILERDKAAADKALEEIAVERESHVCVVAERDKRIHSLTRAKTDLEKKLKHAEERMDREVGELKDAVDLLEAQLLKANESATARDDNASTRQRELQTKMENLKLDAAEKDAAVASGSERIEVLTEELNKLRYFHII